MIILLSLVGLLVGVALGQTYRVFVLVPTSLVVTAVVVTASLVNGQDMLHTLIAALAILVTLQLGYVLGLVAGTLRLRSLPPVMSSTRHLARD